MSHFELKLDNFFGPIDLLLQMIENRKLPINQVSIAKIANEYIGFLNNNSQELEDRTYFLNIVSTLILIKSKSLLPDLSLTEDEEGDIRSLETRLALLKTFQEAGLNIENRFVGKRSLYFAKSKKITPKFNPGDKLNTKNIFDAMAKFFASNIQTVKLSTRKITDVIKLEDVISRLRERVISSMENSFFSFVRESSKKIENIDEKKNYAVVSFLALLELIKSGMIAVAQEGYSSDIRIKNDKI